MTALLIAAIALLALNALLLTAVLVVVLKKAGYAVPFWPPRKPPFSA